MGGYKGIKNKKQYQTGMTGNSKKMSWGGGKLEFWRVRSVLGRQKGQNTNEGRDEKKRRTIDSITYNEMSTNNLLMKRMKELNYLAKPKK